MKSDNDESLAPRKIDGLESDYQTEKLQKTQKNGTLSAVLGVMVSLYYLYQDIYIVGIKDIQFWRSILLCSCLFFLLASHSLYKKWPSSILFLHSVVLFSGAIMMVGINAEIFVNQPEFRYRVMPGTLTLFFGLSLMASGVRNYLAFIVLLPILVLILYLFYFLQLEIKEVSYFANLIFLTVVLCISALFYERLTRKEFFMRKLAENEVKALNQEIKRRKRLEKQLEKEATTDPLTGVLNRRAGYQQLSSALELAKRDGPNFMVCFIDLDNLKIINDRLGHQAGDEYIVHFCNVVTQNIRNIDTFSRFGGDEFIIIFQTIDKATVEQIIKRITALFTIYERFTSQNIAIAFSYGLIEVASKSILLPDELITLADECMYKQKLGKKQAQAQ